MASKSDTACVLN